MSAQDIARGALWSQKAVAQAEAGAHTQCSGAAHRKLVDNRLPLIEGTLLRHANTLRATSQPHRDSVTNQRAAVRRCGVAEYCALSQWHGSGVDRAKEALLAGSSAA